MQWISEDISELKPKEEIYRSIHVEEWFKEIAGPDYFIKDVEMRFSISEEMICQKITYLIRFINDNTYSLIKEKKTQLIGSLRDAICEEIEKCNSSAYCESLDEGKAGVYDLWKHYLWNIEKKYEELKSALDYLWAAEEINIFIMEEEVDPDEVMIYFNYSKKSTNEKPLKRIKMNMSSIALLHYYNEDPINKFNVDEILDSYGYTSSKALKRRYDLLSCEIERHAFRDFNTCFKEMYEYLTPEGKKRALDDLSRWEKRTI